MPGLACSVNVETMAQRLNDSVHAKAWLYVVPLDEA
jgi:hypothetical protein